MNLNEIENRLSILEDYVEGQLPLHSLNENYNLLKEIPVNIFGNKINLKIKCDEKLNKKLESKIDNVIKYISAKSLYNYLYNLNKNYYDSEINSDPYYDGKTIKSGTDLLKSIDFNHKNTTLFLDSDRNCIYFCGEYWVDPEHGFSIVFPNGNFIKGEGKDKKYDSKYNPLFTFMGQYSDAL